MPRARNAAATTAAIDIASALMMLLAAITRARCAGALSCWRIA